MASNEAGKNRTQDRAVVGSADSCDIRIDATKVSRRHCAIYRSTTGFLLEDLDSRNGTYVDGKRIEQKATVASRAQVTLGRSVPFPWDEVLAFFQGQSRSDDQPRRVVTIGRLSGNDLVLSDPTVSGRHARIVFAEGEVFIEDLGSQNGTYLNDDDTPVARARTNPLTTKLSFEPPWAKARPSRTALWTSQEDTEPSYSDATLHVISNSTTRWCR